MGNASQNTFFVDDDEVTLFLYQRLAKKMDIKAQYCKDGQELLDVIQEYEHANIVLDVNMPVVNGLNVVRELDKAGTLENHNIMVMMGSSDVDAVRKELEAYNIQRFETKPLTEDVFKEFLELNTV